MQIAAVVVLVLVLIVITPWILALLAAAVALLGLWIAAALGVVFALAIVAAVWAILRSRSKRGRREAIPVDEI